jgi:hypothetical protein
VNENQSAFKMSATHDFTWPRVFRTATESVPPLQWLRDADEVVTGNATLAAATRTESQGVGVVVQAEM